MALDIPDNLLESRPWHEALCGSATTGQVQGLKQRSLRSIKESMPTIKPMPHMTGITFKKRCKY